MVLIEGRNDLDSSMYCEDGLTQPALQLNKSSLFKDNDCMLSVSMQSTNSQSFNRGINYRGFRNEEVLDEEIQKDVTVVSMDEQSHYLDSPKFPQSRDRNHTPWVSGRENHRNELEINDNSSLCSDAIELENKKTVLLQKINATRDQLTNIRSRQIQSPTYYEKQQSPTTSLGGTSNHISFVSDKVTSQERRKLLLEKIKATKQEMIDFQNKNKNVNMEINVNSDNNIKKQKSVKKSPNNKPTNEKATDGIEHQNRIVIKNQPLPPSRTLHQDENMTLDKSTNESISSNVHEQKDPNDNNSMGLDETNLMSVENTNEMIQTRLTDELTKQLVETKRNLVETQMRFEKLQSDVNRKLESARKTNRDLKTKNSESLQLAWDTREHAKTLNNQVIYLKGDNKNLKGKISRQTERIRYLENILLMKGIPFKTSRLTLDSNSVTSSHEQSREHDSTKIRDHTISSSARKQSGELQMNHNAPFSDNKDILSRQSCEVQSENQNLGPTPPFSPKKHTIDRPYLISNGNNDIKDTSGMFHTNENKKDFDDSDRIANSFSSITHTIIGNSTTLNQLNSNVSPSMKNKQKGSGSGSGSGSGASFFSLKSLQRKYLCSDIVDEEDFSDEEEQQFQFKNM